MQQTVTRTALRGSIFLFLLVMASCRPDVPIDINRNTSQFDKEAAYEWQKLMLDISRYTPGFRATIQARALGYIGLAGYEAAVPGMPRFNSLQPHFPALKLPRQEYGKTYHWALSVHTAYHTIIKAYYPNLPAEQLAKLNLLATDLDSKYSKQIADNAIYTRSKSFGKAVAEAVYAWSATDSIGHNAYLRTAPTDYVPPTGGGKWQPTVPDFSRAFVPYWGKVRTFAMSQADKLSPAPLTYSTLKTSEYYKQGQEIYNLTTPISYDNQWIAEFWSDDNPIQTCDPSTRFISILNQTLVKRNANLEMAVYAYAKVGMAMSDGGVACWHSKYTYNVERPVQFIRANIASAWVTKLNNPLINRMGYTPPFPAYPSGHSVFGAAAADAMISVFGNDNYYDYDRTHEGRTDFIGKPRFFRTFTQMAQENAFSRIPLGVHWRMDCDEGLRLGKLAAQKVNGLKWVKS
ncbi:MAG: vanadium-dependent haloperoxidase [Saprospiraceae bacterium]|nr:vanadium-dependent haloperoxidase [Saprospiraceae bacterium]